MSWRKLTVLLTLSACGRSLEGPTPALTGTTSPTPTVVCNDQVDTDVAIEGTGLSPIVENTLTEPAAIMPSVTLISGETRIEIPDYLDPENSQVRWESRQKMVFTVTPDLTPALAPEAGADTRHVIYDIEVCNRRGETMPSGKCTDPILAGALASVPRPTLTSVSPDPICIAEGPVTITAEGTGFIKIGADRLPTVQIALDGEEVLSIVADADSMTDCQPIGDFGADSCTGFTFTVPQEALDSGDVFTTYDLTVLNPLSTGATEPCHTEEAVTLTVVPPPELTVIEPDLLCEADGAVSVTAVGTGFLTIDGVQPTVNVNGTTIPATVDDTTCQEVTGPSVVVQSCTELTFSVAQDSLLQDLYDVTVTNPLPANCTTDSQKLFITDDPVIAGLDISDPLDGVADTPQSVCEGLVPPQIEIQGTFLRIDGVDPTVTLGGDPATILSVNGCTDLQGAGTQPDDIIENVDTCTGITIEMPSPMILAGDYDIIVTNPETPDNPAAPAAATPGCVSAASTFSVGPQPTITMVEPEHVCADVMDTVFTITGSGYTGGTAVTFFDGATTFTPDDVAQGTPEDQQLIVTFNAGLPPGFYDVTVSNGTGCEDTRPAAVEVHRNPFVFFVDPPIVYNGINTQVTVYVTDVNFGGVDFVGISPAGSGDPPTQLAVPPPGPDYPFSGNKVLAIVDNSITPFAAGSYDVHITDKLGCVATLPDGLQVTDNVTPMVLAIDPEFGWTNSQTPVSITSGNDGFVATPRVYLNPGTGCTEALASAVSSVGFITTGELTGVVASGLEACSYDVIVINPLPGQEVGLLPDGFTVTAEPPPVVDNITPGSVTTNDGNVVTVTGTGFAMTPRQDATVDIRCRPPGGVPGAFIPIDGAGDVVVSSDQTIQLTIDSSNLGLAGGYVCLVRVTNPDDGSFGTFSAISVTNPSQNINDFENAGQALNVARRAPAAVAGRATRAARFLYAIGGDDNAGTALSSVETTAVSPFGALPVPWRTLPDLPGPRTLADAAVLGRFIYLVGGNDGTNVLDTVMRAEVLDPGRGPDIVDLNFNPPPPVGTGTGTPGPGTWNYKVSAVFPPTDNDNPNGESLPGDVQPVTVPDLADLEVQILWDPVPGASAYRIYRSVTPGEATGGELLIEEVDAASACAALPCSYGDDGDPMPSGTGPKEIGALGEWATVATLNTPREGLGVGIAQDPDTPNRHYLYAVGGQDDTGLALDTYEVLGIDVDGNGSHTVGAFTLDGVNTLTTGRWQLGVYSMDNALAFAIPPGDSYIYALGGLDDGDNAVIEAMAALVQGDGTLAGWTAVDDLGPARVGFGAVGANNFLLAFAGSGALDGTPLSNSRTVPICETGGGTCEGPAPDLENWNNDPATFVCERYLMGTARESATVFLIGGNSSCGDPTATTESTAW